MKKILSIFLAASLLAACQKTDSPVITPGKITISPIITKATDTDFEENDRIGLSVTKGDEAYLENQQLIFSNGVFSSDAVWYAEAAQTSTLTAYYPYMAEGAPEKFSVETDQREGYGNSDLMASVKTNVTPSSNAVNMIFKHLLSKIIVDIENESGSEIAEVALKGSVPTADINLADLTAVADEKALPADIIMQKVSDTLYRAIVVPQTVAFTLNVKTSSGKELAQELVSMQLKQGGQYTVTARVTSDDIKITVSGDIENWEDEGEIGAAENEVPFEEFDGYFIYDGERYNTVTLANGTTWMAEPLRYVPDGYTPSSDASADSHIWYPYSLENDSETLTVNASRAVALTDEESIKKFGYLYDMEIALGEEVTVENCYDFEGAQGICPKGWHIPTRAEFFNLCGLSNKAAEGETGNQINEDALFYDENYGGGKLPLYDQAGWNYVRSGVRMMSNFNSEAKYQLTQLYSGNSSDESQYGTIGLTYIMSSTCYKPIYSSANPEELTNIQFFTQMTTFTKLYPEGRINVAYAGILCGQQLRCVKDSE